MFDYCRLYVGQAHTPAQIIEQLIRCGYVRVDQVADPGECAARGGVVDVFPATFESPVRVEVEGAHIRSLRSFNPVSLETLDRHSMVVILPKEIRTHARPTSDIPFESFVDIEMGDLVVHLDHGIGRFLGKTTLGTPSGAQDVLVVEYAAGDRLYIPTGDLHLLQRYAAFGAKRPSLSKLGGTAWEKAKSKAFVGAYAYAKSLLELHAKRVALPGYGFSPDHEWQKQFEAKFPYRETPDQAQAIADVKRDMELPRPMDRLLLGDVGYGKTEVAIRAAFKAVMDHKQVAVLVPTTILGYQHYRTFTRRIEGFPIEVAMLSRFQTEAEQRRIIEALREGHCDVVIGTHRLLSGDVKFKDLGLLIVDEEQRFGLRDKEHLKEWRTQTDVLTLSATPIPRTLYLSIAGARDLSLIMTPPENRHPVETHIVEEDRESLRRWITRELKREGQVFIVHNRVHTIARAAQRVKQLVPEARVSVAHGQMDKHELEQVMIAYIDGRIDVLVATTIIESGIDIPNANTLVIEGAEAFGLADLYQLRGRVGRFDRKAYAYLVVPEQAVLTEESRRRLEAMTQHTSLGSGFQIAMEDLKLRGAGNLLGIEQSGHISLVGFDLYCRLLREAVNRVKEESPNGTMALSR